jgi:hypothetical protein
VNWTWLLLAGVIVVPAVALGTYAALAWLFRDDDPHGDAATRR